jgi:DNA invertase Pin-like site-specific DNA recombinase
MARLLVTMLAGIAQFERELIKARTGEGQEASAGPVACVLAVRRL